MSQLDRIEKMLEYITRGEIDNFYGTFEGDQKFYDIIDAPFDEEDLIEVWKREIHVET